MDPATTTTTERLSTTSEIVDGCVRITEILRIVRIVPFCGVQVPGQGVSAPNPPTAPISQTGPILPTGTIATPWRIMPRAAEVEHAVVTIPPPVPSAVTVPPPVSSTVTAPPSVSSAVTVPPPVSSTVPVLPSAASAVMVPPSAASMPPPLPRIRGTGRFICPPLPKTYFQNFILPLVPELGGDSSRMDDPFGDDFCVRLPSHMLHSFNRKEMEEIATTTNTNISDDIEEKHGYGVTGTGGSASLTASALSCVYWWLQSKIRNGSVTRRRVTVARCGEVPFFEGAIISTVVNGRYTVVLRITKVYREVLGALIGVAGANKKRIERSHYAHIDIFNNEEDAGPPYIEIRSSAMAGVAEANVIAAWYHCLLIIYRICYDYTDTQEEAVRTAPVPDTGTTLRYDASKKGPMMTKGTTAPSPPSMKSAKSNTLGGKQWGDTPAEEEEEEDEETTTSSGGGGGGGKEETK